MTELGADDESVRKLITPERASDLGDRLILSPAALNPEITADAVRKMAHQFSRGNRGADAKSTCTPVNVVVLVPSDDAALAWKICKSYIACKGHEANHRQNGFW